MTLAGWAVVAVLASVIVWLGLALIGAVRELAALRARVDALEGSDAPVHLDGGLAVGAAAPAWSISTPEGDAATSAQLRGRRHLLVFADADCRACDDLVPAVVRAAAAGTLPVVAVVGRGRPEATPAAWRADASGRVLAGVEHDRDVSDAFGVEVSPHVFVIDEGGFVVGRSGATTFDEVRSLSRGAHGIRIIPEALDG